LRLLINYSPSAWSTWLHPAWLEGSTIQKSDRLINNLPCQIESASFTYSCLPTSLFSFQSFQILLELLDVFFRPVPIVQGLVQSEVLIRL
jgi:hypothetical protein